MSRARITFIWRTNETEWEEFHSFGAVWPLCEWKRVTSRQPTAPGRVARANGRRASYVRSLGPRGRFLSVCAVSDRSWPCCSAAARNWRAQSRLPPTTTATEPQPCPWDFWGPIHTHWGTNDHQQELVSARSRSLRHSRRRTRLRLRLGLVARPPPAYPIDFLAS